MPAGKVELEQYVDLEPLRAVSPLTGERQWYLPSSFQAQIEIGLTDRLELDANVSPRFR